MPKEREGLDPHELAITLPAKLVPDFVETPYLGHILTRARLYLEAGYPVHLQGATGTGKTTLALHLADLLGRPVILVYGNDEFGVQDLIGGNLGYLRKYVVDNFIHSVTKTKEDVVRHWVDERITVACRYGYTLVYDEFTRSRPEANNALLSILEERILDLPSSSCGENRYLQVHPEFRAIFTSNPEEYAGVHKSQDALRDRMITLDLDYFDAETELMITSVRAKLAPEEARPLVNIVRRFREQAQIPAKPTIRASITLARLVKQRGLKPMLADPLFVGVCFDILAFRQNRQVMSRTKVEEIQQLLAELITTESANGMKAKSNARKGWENGAGRAGRTRQRRERDGNPS